MLFQNGFSTRCASSHQKKQGRATKHRLSSKNTTLKLSEPNKYMALRPPLLRKLMHFLLLHFLVLILQFFHESMSRM